MRISDWSSDVCSSDLPTAARFRRMTTDAISVDDFREKAQAWLAEHKGEAPRDYGAILPPDLADQGRAWQRLILAGGFAGIHWPPEYGGLGLTPAHHAAWATECSTPEVPPRLHLVALLLVGGSLLIFCTPAPHAHPPPGSSN